MRHELSFNEWIEELFAVIRDRSTGPLMRRDWMAKLPPSSELRRDAWANGQEPEEIAAKAWDRVHRGPAPNTTTVRP